MVEQIATGFTEPKRKLVLTFGLCYLNLHQQAHHACKLKVEALKQR